MTRSRRSPASSPDHRQLRDKFKAVPWTVVGRQAVPDGQHVAFTHWSGRQRRRPGRRQAGRRLAVLLERLRRGARDVHGRLPLQRLPRARGGCSRTASGQVRRGLSRSRSTIALTSWARARVVTSRASAVSTTTTSSMPIRATGRPRVRHHQPGASSRHQVLRRRAPHAARRRRRAVGQRAEVADVVPGELPGTIATRPASAAGSATAWSRAILGRVGPQRPAGPRRRRGRAGRAAKPGCRAAEQVEQHPRTDDEHPGVPAVAAGRRYAGHVGRRLLDERLDRERPGWPAARADVDVPEGGGGAGGRDAERDQPVVGGHLDRERTARRRPRGRRSRGRRRRSPSPLGVAALEQRGGSPIAAMESRGDGSASTRRPEVRQLGSTAPGGRRRSRPAFGRGQWGEPGDGLLEQRAAGAGEVVQELRGRRPRQRPQPGARATGRDHGPEVLDRKAWGGQP